MAKAKRQADHRADCAGGNLSGLPHVVSDSAAYLWCTPFERAVFAEILRRFNGYNNGQIAISYEELSDRLKGANRTAINGRRIADALARLVERGLIAEPEPGDWLQRKAREYRLTFISYGKAAPFRSATNEYRRWTPPEAKNVSDARSPESPHAGDARSPKPLSAGDARSPETEKNGSFALPNPSASGDARSPLIDKPYGAVPRNGLPRPSICGRAAFELRCEACGSLFDQTKRTRRFCSENCRKAAEKKRWLARQATPAGA